MSVPAAHGTKRETRSLPIARRNVTNPVERAEGDSLLAAATFFPSVRVARSRFGHAVSPRFSKATLLRQSSEAVSIASFAHLSISAIG